MRPVRWWSCSWPGSCGSNRPDLGRLWGVLASVAGVCIIGIGSAWQGGGPSAETRATMLADLLLIGAVLSWGGYLAVSKPLVMRHGSMPVLTATFLAGALLDLPLALSPRPTFPPLSQVSPSAWIALAVLTLFITPVNLACQNLAMRRLDASQVANFSNISPILTVIWVPGCSARPSPPAWSWAVPSTLAGVFWTARSRPSAIARRSCGSAVADPRRHDWPISPPRPSRSPCFLGSRLKGWKDLGRAVEPSGRRDDRRSPRTRLAMPCIVRERSPPGMSRGARRGGRGRLRDEPRFRPPEPDGGGAEPDPPRIPVSIRSMPACSSHLAASGDGRSSWGVRLGRGAVNPPGDSNTTEGRATLERAIRVHAGRWPGWTRRSAGCRAGDRRGPLRCAGRAAGGRPSGRDSRLRDVQLHLGRHLRPLCPGARRRGAPGWSPTSARPIARPRRCSGCSRP